MKREEMFEEAVRLLDEDDGGSTVDSRNRYLRSIALSLALLAGQSLPPRILLGYDEDHPIIAEDCPPPPNEFP